MTIPNVECLQQKSTAKKKPLRGSLSHKLSKFKQSYLRMMDCFSLMDLLFQNLYGSMIHSSLIIFFQNFFFTIFLPNRY